jgi:hypothetical protein
MLLSKLVLDYRLSKGICGRAWNVQKSRFLHHKIAGNEIRRLQGAEIRAEMSAFRPIATHGAIRRQSNQLGFDLKPYLATLNSVASATAMPIIVRTETRNGSSTLAPPTGASQTSISLFSVMNFVAGRSGRWPAIGT